MTIFLIPSSPLIMVMTREKCKIGLVSERYGLDTFERRYNSVDEHLLTRWTGTESVEPVGYRTLTDWFNKRLLRAAYDEHGRDTVGTRIESDYEALTGEDELLREEVMDDLRADGLAPERLRQDMVSWSTMRQHLTSCLGGEKRLRESDSDWERKSVAIATNITESKVEDALSSLDSRGTLPEGGRADITVQVLLGCPNCQTRVPFEDAISRGFVCKDHFPNAQVGTGDD